MLTLLVVDDEPTILHAFGRAFNGPELRIFHAGSAAAGMEWAKPHVPDVIIFDVKLPDMSGLEAFRIVRAWDARIPVILITGHGTTATAIEAIKNGAFDYLLKPLDLGPLRDVVERAFHVSRAMKHPVALAAEPTWSESAEAIVGRCP